MAKRRGKIAICMRLHIVAQTFIVSHKKPLVDRILTVVVIKEMVCKLIRFTKCLLD